MTSIYYTSNDELAIIPNLHNVISHHSTNPTKSHWLCLHCASTFSEERNHNRHCWDHQGWKVSIQHERVEVTKQIVKWNIQIISRNFIEVAGRRVNIWVILPVTIYIKWYETWTMSLQAMNCIETVNNGRQKWRIR